MGKYINGNTSQQYQNPDGTLKPFYLKRKFTLLQGDKFELAVTNFADSYGKVPLPRMEIKGHTEWKGEYPIASGAQKVDFIADGGYAVTPLLQAFADVLNQYTKGFNEWKVGETQNILKKAFAPFGLTDGQIFREYDLINLNGGLMFWEQEMWMDVVLSQRQTVQPIYKYQ